ncbi:hypothetical protein [Ancylobacter sp. SL191]|uniref:hypothetical protein n=1 Tax=Ancylobacter sp. SL191 TaxID=2995166 RepID=UPI00226FC829|nr:hypothetical protein [Ancylobacter sp. SL191]WAC26421.1 hypothetical protein OU996_15550 [Ancylobacter sp. SL191]
MLAAAALRLAVIEALCPTAAVRGEDGATFPTLAEHRVFDSRQILVDELDDARPYTPSISVYVEDVRVERRGDAAPSVRGNPTCTLVIVTELAEIARDPDGDAVRQENGNLATMALVDSDPRQRLVLEALTAQVRKVIVRGPEAVAVRRVMKAVQSIELEAFSLPQLSRRWLRYLMLVSCEIADDKFTDAPGLPEPLRSVAAELPDGSYAKAKLAELGAAFLATSRDALDGIDVIASVNGVPVIRRPEATPD